MVAVLFAVGGDSLIGADDKQQIDPTELAVFAGWMAALVFVSVWAVQRWFARGRPAVLRVGIAVLAAVLAGALTANLSRALDRGFLAGVMTFLACLIATGATPVLLGVAYLLHRFLRRSRRTARPTGTDGPPGPGG